MSSVCPSEALQTLQIYLLLHSVALLWVSKMIMAFLLISFLVHLMSPFSFSFALRYLFTYVPHAYYWNVFSGLFFRPAASQFLFHLRHICMVARDRYIVLISWSVNLTSMRAFFCPQGVTVWVSFPLLRMYRETVTDRQKPEKSGACSPSVYSASRVPVLPHWKYPWLNYP